MHMATLIHKMNLLLLEFDNIKQLKTVLGLIFSKQLLEAIIEFVMSTDNFANFGIRFLEILSIEYSRQIVEQSDVLPVMLGLLRTNDYETIVQCMSFVATLLCSGELEAVCVVNKKMMSLLLKITQKHKEIEYVNYIVQICNQALMSKDLRSVILSEEEEFIPLLY